MCIIVVHGLKAAPVTESTLRRCHENNPDGMGLMWAERGHLHMWRSMKEVQEMTSRVVELQSRGMPYVAHFRLATHGSMILENCHPVEVTPGVGLMHNGILDVPDHEQWSDTRVFAHATLRQLPRGWYRHRGICRLIEQAIGYGNKLTVMDRTGYIRIFNSEMGEWTYGNWFSNGTYMVRLPRKRRGWALDWSPKALDALSVENDDADVEPGFAYQVTWNGKQVLFCEDCCPVNVGLEQGVEDVMVIALTEAVGKECAVCLRTIVRKGKERPFWRGVRSDPETTGRVA